MRIREIEDGDVKACLGIYNYYIENTVFTFEEKALSYDAFFVY
jgi:L-amino acid N-acyltransferase YncA